MSTQFPSQSISVEQLRKVTEDRDRLFNALSRVGNVASTAGGLLHSTAPAEAALFRNDAGLVKEALQASLGVVPPFERPFYPKEVHSLLGAVKRLADAFDGDVPDWIQGEVATVDEAVLAVRNLPGLALADSAAVLQDEGGAEPAGERAQARHQQDESMRPWSRS